MCIVTIFVELPGNYRCYNKSNEVICSVAVKNLSHSIVFQFRFAYFFFARK